MRATQRVRHRAGGGSERGAVTVEAAIALAALLTVLGFTMVGLAAVTDQIRCTDAAREAARLIARGEPELADQAVDRIAPSGARWDIDHESEGFAVTVSAVPAGGLLPGVTARAEAFAVLEPGVGTDGESGGESGRDGARGRSANDSPAADSGADHE